MDSSNYLAIYRYRWSKREIWYVIQTDCVTPVGWVQQKTFLRCVSKGFIRGCSSLSLLKRSKYIAVVIQIDPNYGRGLCWFFNWYFWIFVLLLTKREWVLTYWLMVRLICLRWFLVASDMGFLNALWVYCCHSLSRRHRYRGYWLGFQVSHWVL